VQSLKQKSGLTLIEVLVALAIVAIALTSLIISNLEIIKNRTHLDNKLISHWIAINKINEVRLGLINVPFKPNEYKGTTNMLRKNFDYKISLLHTNDPNTKKIEVIVGLSNSTYISKTIGFVMDPSK